jgi:hypothetical protein
MNSNKKKAYVAVMLVAGLALVADRFLLGDTEVPNLAQAGLTLPKHAAAQPEASAMTAGNAALSIPELAFPKNLPALEPQRRLRDVFAPPARYVVVPDVIEPGDAGKNAADGLPGTPQGLPAEAFRARYQLTAVFRDAGVQLVIVGGHWLRIGQELEGCELVEIGENHARFSCGDEDAVLPLFNEDDLTGN